MTVWNLELNKILKKYGNTKSLYIIIIIGVVLMLLSTSGEPKNDTKTPVYSTYSDEVRLQEILSKVKGAGNVSVMITYSGTSSYDVAYDKKETSSNSQEQVTKSAESTAISKGGEPFIRGEVYPEVKGVIIIAGGAGDVRIKKALTDAACAALSVASYRVCVLEGKELRK